MANAALTALSGPNSASIFGNDDNDSDSASSSSTSSSDIFGDLVSAALGGPKALASIVSPFRSIPQAGTSLGGNGATKAKGHAAHNKNVAENEATGGGKGGHGKGHGHKGHGHGKGKGHGHHKGHKGKAAHGAQQPAKVIKPPLNSNANPFANRTLANVTAAAQGAAQAGQQAPMRPTKSAPIGRQFNNLPQAVPSRTTVQGPPQSSLPQSKPTPSQQAQQVPTSAQRLNKGRAAAKAKPQPTGQVRAFTRVVKGREEQVRSFTRRVKSLGN